jgi:hypothetical protein
MGTIQLVPTSSLELQKLRDLLAEEVLSYSGSSLNFIRQLLKPGLTRDLLMSGGMSRSGLKWR